jgi:hypothetical protein
VFDFSLLRLAAADSWHQEKPIESEAKSKIVSFGFKNLFSCSNRGTSIAEPIRDPAVVDGSGWIGFGE